MFLPVRTGLLTMLLAPFLLQAQAPKYSNEFMNIGVGARALAMSGSSIASVNDVTSGYWNPAGLTGIKSDFDIGLMHAEYFAGIAKYDYLGIGRKIDSSSAFGVSILRFGVDNIPNTIDLIDPSGNINYDRITTFSAADYGFLLSYARKIASVPGLSLGGSAKIIHRIVGDFATAWGFGLDAGLQYRTGKWLLGVTGRDLTGTFNAWNFTLSDQVKEVWALTGNELPESSLEITVPKLMLGVARKEQFGKFSLAAEAGADLTFDGRRNTALSTGFVSGDPHLGLEGGYKDLIFIRAGIGNFQKVSEVKELDRLSWQPNVGIGVHIKSFTLDYALTDIGDRSVALYSNVFSLRIDINRQTR